ncbi:MAG: methyltransferase domain-containing protein [Gaiellaceae bacterium]
MSGRRDTKTASRDYFDRHAADYETHRRWRWLRRPQAEAVTTLELTADDQLLDVGCGSGRAVRAAAPLVARAVGLDLSPKMIGEARQLSKGIVNAEFELGDSEHLPFGDGEFTAVLCTSSFHHYPNPGRAVKEMGRVLAPSGRLALGDLNRDHLLMRLIDRLGRRFDASHAGIRNTTEIAHYMSEAGLTPIAFRRFWHGFYVIVLAQKPGAE